MSITFFDTNNYSGQKAETWAKDYLTEEYEEDLDPYTLYVRYIRSKFNKTEFEDFNPILETLSSKLKEFEPVVPENQINDWLWHQEEMDFEETEMHLTNALDCIDSKTNPSAGNHFLIQGQIQHWNGTSTGIQIEDSFKNIFRSRGVFKDCDIHHIIVNDKDIDIEGHHHDGGVYINARQLTNEGETYLDQLDYGYIPNKGITIDNETFEEDDENKFLHYLFENYTENLEDVLQ